MLLNGEKIGTHVVRVWNALDTREVHLKCSCGWDVVFPEMNDALELHFQAHVFQSHSVLLNKILVQMVEALGEDPETVEVDPEAIVARFIENSSDVEHHDQHVRTQALRIAMMTWPRGNLSLDQVQRVTRDVQQLADIFVGYIKNGYGEV